MSDILDNISTDTLKVIAKLHLTEFQNKTLAAQMGTPGYRLSECSHYLSIWRAEVERMLEGPVAPMTEEAAREYKDALACGEYDQYLQPEELDLVQQWRGDDGSFA